MQEPLEVSFRGVERTRDIENLIQKEVEKLERICDSIIGGHVSVERPQKHQDTGSSYRVRIGISVPRNPELVAVREPGEGEMHQPLHTVIKSTFKKTRRQLKKYMEKRKKDVKYHPQEQFNAVVEKLFKNQGYGFLKNREGREVYFHKNSVLHGGFDSLEIGTGVHYIGEEGQKGPQASTVRIVDKPGVRASKTQKKPFFPEGWEPQKEE